VHRVHERGEQPGAAGAERVAERDRAAVDADPGQFRRPFELMIRTAVQFYYETQSPRSAFHHATFYAYGMQRTSFEDMTCSVAKCLDIVGEWWSLLVVRDAMLGVTRFDDFQARLGISRNILTQRLNRLVDNDILKRVPYSEHPPRSEYRLTAKGRDLWLVIAAMRQWGDRWATAEDTPVRLRHDSCGEVVTVLPACSHCGQALDARSVSAVPGPGVAADTFYRTPLEAAFS
jgi:DNA-binding HxlR family transcriptional regulator